MTFADLCRNVFLLAHIDLKVKGPVRGEKWERVVEEYLTRNGVPVADIPAGCRIFGHLSLSGLPHQIDGCFGCSDAIVIAEWKAHSGAIPKNELLRFKAATDDYFLGLASCYPKRPVMRIFGGPGRASDALRTYAALHGIGLIEPDRWPSTVLASRESGWPGMCAEGPDLEDRRTLSWMVRPVQQVLLLQPDGGFRIPRAPSPASVEAVLRLQDFWSDHLWEAVDGNPGSFESMVERVCGWRGIN